MKKKEESIFLNRKVREKDELFQKMVKCLCQIMSPEQSIHFIDQLSKAWNVKVPATTQPRLKRVGSRGRFANKVEVPLSEFLLANFVTTQAELDEFQ